MRNTQIKLTNYFHHVEYLFIFDNLYVIQANFAYAQSSRTIIVPMYM